MQRAEQELHLAAVATPLVGDSGGSEGVVLVLDDVTPLIRTQKVAAWREVARRLAHEIKNPLTPIQLSAERLRRHFTDAPAGARALVDECTTTITGEVESLKALVDEFAQFARMPAPRTVPSDLNALLGDTLALYNGLFQEIQIERRFAEELPQVRVDIEQLRRVVINLVDNAVEALGGSAAAVVVVGVHRRLHRAESLGVESATTTRRALTGGVSWLLEALGVGALGTAGVPALVAGPAEIGALAGVDLLPGVPADVTHPWRPRLGVHRETERVAETV